MPSPAWGISRREAEVGKPGWKGQPIKDQPYGGARESGGQDPGGRGAVSGVVSLSESEELPEDSQCRLPP